MTEPEFLIPPHVFAEMILLTCPHCKAGVPLSQRTSNAVEWVHMTQGGTPESRVITTVLCWANGLRNSRFNPDNGGLK